MDNRLPKNVTGIPIVSKRGLFLSKAYQPHNPLPITENEDSYAVSNKNHGNSLALMYQLLRIPL